MKLLLLSDIHSWSDTNYPNKRWKDYINSFWSTISANIDVLSSIAQSVDLVVNLGDFIHETSLGSDIYEYKRWMQLLSSLWKPVLHIAGNHDLVYLDRAILSELWQTEHLYYFRDMNGYRHIVLDWNREGNRNGIIEKWQSYRFDQVQIEWLTNVLSASPSPCVVYSHFPLDDQDVSSNYYWKDAWNPHERAFPQRYLEIRKILNASWKVVAVFNGHTHFHNKMNIDNIAYINVGSFSENDGTWRPTKEYAIASFDNGCIDVSFEKM